MLKSPTIITLSVFNPKVDKKSTISPGGENGVHEVQLKKIVSCWFEIKVQQQQSGTQW